MARMDYCTIAYATAIVCHRYHRLSCRLYRDLRCMTLALPGRPPAGHCLFKRRPVPYFSGFRDVAHALKVPRHGNARMPGLRIPHTTRYRICKE
jgi:hypothetical protein